MEVEVVEERALRVIGEENHLVFEGLREREVESGTEVERLQDVRVGEEGESTRLELPVGLPGRREDFSEVGNGAHADAVDPGLAGRYS